jgi:hypothetical protein
MSKKIFISYSRQDRDKIPEALAILREQALRGEEDLVLVDSSTEFEAGDDIRSTIRQNIEKTDLVVVLWTESSATSSWVNYEAGMADALGKKIIVLQLDENPPELPINLKDMQVVNFKKS